MGSGALFITALAVVGIGLIIGVPSYYAMQPGRRFMRTFTVSTLPDDLHDIYGFTYSVAEIIKQNNAALEQDDTTAKETYLFISMLGGYRKLQIPFSAIAYTKHHRDTKEINAVQLVFKDTKIAPCYLYFTDEQLVYFPKLIGLVQ